MSFSQELHRLNDPILLSHKERNSRAKTLQTACAAVWRYKHRPAYQVYLGAGNGTGSISQTPTLPIHLLTQISAELLLNGHGRFFSHPGRSLYETDQNTLSSRYGGAGGHVERDEQSQSDARRRLSLHHADLPRRSAMFRRSLDSVRNLRNHLLQGVGRSRTNN